MEYDEKKITGGVPVLAIAQLALEATKVLFTPGAPTPNIQLYENPNIKSIAQRKNINVEVAISIAFGQAKNDTGKDMPSNDEILEAAEKVNNMSDKDLGSLVDSIKSHLAENKINPNVPLTQQKSLIQNMAAQTGEFKHLQKEGHNVFVKAVGFSLTWPWEVFKNIRGDKSEEEQREADEKQIAYDKQIWKKQNYTDGEITWMLRQKSMNPKLTNKDVQKLLGVAKRRSTGLQSMPRRTGRGEISGLQIAKLVLLVLVIIIVFASAATGSKMMLGFLPFLLLGLGGVALYDYLKTETPKQ